MDGWMGVQWKYKTWHVHWIKVSNDPVDYYPFQVDQSMPLVHVSVVFNLIVNVNVNMNMNCYKWI